MTTAQDAASGIRDGDTLLISGGGEYMLPDAVLEALETRFLKTGSPKDLTLVYNVFPGGARPGTGIERLTHPGMVRRVYAGSYYSLRATGLSDLVKSNAIEAYLLPYGFLYGSMRAAASNQPGVLTRVGLNTFVDPRSGGGRITERTTDDFLSLVEIGSETFIFVPALSFDVAILRATTADEANNLSIEQEPNTMGLLAMAMATSGSGGRVVAQVKQRAVRGSIHPRRVTVPGIFVDEIVVAPNQMDHAPYQPALTGDVRLALDTEPKPVVSHRDVIVRRAAMELRPATLVNVGMGLSASVPQVALEEGIVDHLLFNTEHGPVGGLPNDRESFGPGVNMSAVMDPPQIFDMYAAGRLDMTFLGLGEVDREGNVNVSFINGKHNLGGFIDIVHATDRIVFCGNFTGNGFSAEVADGEMQITREGAALKFVNEVQQRSFSARLAIERGQKVLYVTERAVFELGSDGLVLIEVAPGVDIENDILAQMAFAPIISPELTLMPAEVFRPGQIGLGLRNGFEKGI